MVFSLEIAAAAVRIVGSTERVDDAEADAYFASRTRGNKDQRLQASEQSRPLEGRFELEKRVARFAASLAPATCRARHVDRVSRGTSKWVLARQAVSTPRTRGLPT